jgi:ribosomal protein L37AE/L43A
MQAVTITYGNHALRRVKTPHPARDRHAAPVWTCLICGETHAAKSMYPRHCKPEQHKGD